MVILLVILLFALYVVVDRLIDRRRDAELLEKGESLHDAFLEMEPEWVGEFKVPPVLSYHRGHTWVHWVSPDQAYVGLDDFARRLLGKDARVSVPAVGTQVGQGDDVIKVRRHGQTARLLAPVAGEVVGVNPRLKEDPDLFYRDNYGRGWVCRIRSPRLFREIPSLLNGSLAQRWMEDTRDQFQRKLMVATGSVIQDGGASVEDIASGLAPNEWRSLVNEFLMPQSGATEGEVR